ncbi:ABC transporter substrate-binding protein [Eoetvoesiella caeni]|uniref:Branched-chain amino acid transport system substrate-binding protein n=1 Tax=Eoetvoesiella caeni TaxID=645616 RepID=A0A366HHA7_9BURK|nr:ABC transporter substrate-binding protein [Eoetvoesiella caeni]MCI2808121.1 ABC transporter substrate-binding protein [Eoetvoesiella caeni]NYT53877.1 ABC transporter substrate-binding protein [Eoetvoesiella caeni]RBP42044.1 branched-chain amino acid transport system substrate-binding protein [Eoetvoesiella caeni]
MQSFLGRYLGTGAVLFAAAALAFAGPAKADEIKVGLLSQYSGTYSWWGQEYDKGTELFLSEHGGKVGGHTITMVRRDEGGASPQRARQLAQELVVRDKVQYLVGGAFTPTVMGTADIVNQTKTPYVFVNGATANMTDKSPYFVRVGYTSWAYCVPLITWAYENGAHKAVTVTADYAPGADIVDAFNDTFKKLGGAMVENIKVPLGTTDFSTYLQRISDSGVKHVFMFMPVGPMSAGFIKAYQERGLSKGGIALYAGAETQESDLPAIGDSALGIVTALHYSPYLDTKANKDFVAKYKAKFGKDALPSLASMAAYDAMTVVAHMIEATGGKNDGDKAIASAKGFAWESPRGPVSIDPETREIVQNIYMRRVEKVADGALGNVPFFTYKAVSEPWHVAQKAK